jgi:hypothetical protein
MMTTKKRGTTKTRVKTATLSSMEEKVVRMRHGLRAPEGLVLETADQGNAELAAKLAEIERRVIAAAGARPSDTKRKIVSALRRKNDK